MPDELDVPQLAVLPLDPLAAPGKPIPPVPERSWALECAGCRVRLINETPGERPPVRCPACGSAELRPVHGDYDSAEELQQNPNIQAVCTTISRAMVAEIQAHGSDPTKYMFTVSRLLDAVERLTGMANVRAVDAADGIQLGGGIQMGGGYVAYNGRARRGRWVPPLNGAQPLNGVLEEHDEVLAEIVGAFDRRYVQQPPQPARFQQNVLDFVTAAKRAVDLFDDPAAKTTLRDQVTSALATAHAVLVNEGQPAKALPEGGQKP